MKFVLPMMYAASALALSTPFSGPAEAFSEQLIYSFPAGAYPNGRPDLDGKGILYGTATNLGGKGAAFKLKEKGGVWRSKILYEFGGSNGEKPVAGPLIDHATGVLYGTTLYGGTGYGTIYSLAPVGHGWSETVLHSFSYSDGGYPVAVLMKDKATGNLYGITQAGGTYDCGTAFQLSPSNGAWTFSTIYTFQGGSDACSPWTQLKPGAKRGTLIGATLPADAYGQIFQLKEKNGVWTDSIVYNFTGGTSGGFPFDLDAASDGTIYGVAQSGGQTGNGVVFKLSPNLNNYAYSVIYGFDGEEDGSLPVGINLDAATGNLYGTTNQGGTANLGTVFELSPSGNTWTETLLHSFTGGSNDGEFPQSRPAVDRTAGALYGTTLYGGASNGGTVYQVQP